MDDHQTHRPAQRPDQRPPLRDTTMRANNMASQPGPRARASRPANLKIENREPSRTHHEHLKLPSRAAPASANPRMAAVTAMAGARASLSASVSATSGTDSKRVSQVSQISATSNNSNTSSNFRKLKTHVGPWMLGKTLGKGSSARVRLGRHSQKDLKVAIKIISKDVCHITQPGSLAKLDEIDSALPDDVHGVRRMPLTLEREVAILKLIDHPNIVHLHDIWESRNAIYLIMEFVERGDLFEYILTFGAMREDEALCVFRQVMAGIDYCHSYGICHRDLKPENILITAYGKIKIADFGLAALHQGPQERLHTSCGSPHYAAPELLRSKSYRGEKSDIWSMGVILFVMLASRLPFDDDDLHVMVSKAKKAIYVMPPEFSPEAKDFIHRILQVNPDVRISMNEMWKHPLVWKYGYMDQLKSREGIADPRLQHKNKPLDFCSIDPQILRQLQAMWHTFSERELVAKLVSNGPNDQKLFYWLLVEYRERQLEDYDPNLTHSASDYHHLRPPQWSTRVSTRQFSTSRASGHGRSISRFTVISNVPETEVGEELGTIRSYDPYKSSVVMPPQASQAKIVIHRDSTAPTYGGLYGGYTGPSKGAKARANSNSSSQRHSRAGGEPGGRLMTPRSSMSSLPSGRLAHHRVRANSRHKRAVDFSGLRRQSTLRRLHSLQGIAAPASIAGDETTYERDFSSPSSPHKTRKFSDRDASVPKPPAKPATADRHTVFSEELRHFSNIIAKDCDEAFNSSLLSEQNVDEDGSLKEASFSLTLGPPTPDATPTAVQAPTHPWDSRPLPPTPPSSSHNSEFPVVAYTEKFAPAAGPRGPRGMGSMSTPSPAERRVVSAPVHGQHGARALPMLPSIFENTPEPAQHNASNPRNVSAPTKSPAPLPTPHEKKGLDFLATTDKTIRIVNSPSEKRAAAAAATIEPLHIRKKNTTVARGAREMQPSTRASADPEGGQQQSSTAKQTQSQIKKTESQGSGSTFAMRKKKSWFKRLSKDSKESSAASEENSNAQVCPRRMDSSSTHPNRTESTTSSGAPPPPAVTAKKRSFIFPFWRSSKSEPRMSIAGPEYDEAEISDARPGAKSRKSNYRLDMDFHKRDLKGSSKSTAKTSPKVSSFPQDTGERMIKPQQSWLARLFRVKPATRTICLQISKRRARQELAIMLRDWRKWGIRDVVVDKDRNIVFAKLSSKNHLNIKEVDFACEIITVIEHGKRHHLSIVRFTQERGAASSFHKVVDGVQNVLVHRGLLVADEKKAKMMIKTLNS